MTSLVDIPHALPQEIRPQLSSHCRELRILLEESKLVISGDDDDSEDDEGSEKTQSSSHNDSEMDDACLISGRITTLVRCLVDIGVALESPAKDPEYLHQSGISDAPKTMMPHHSYSQRIQDRFPMAPADVVDHLGQANFQRHQRLIDRVSQEERAAQNMDLQDTSQYAASEEATSERAGHRNMWMWLLDPSCRDSALGSSIPTAANHSQKTSTEASSIMSALAQESWRVFPKLTEEAKYGKPFQCDGCGRMVVMTKFKHWKYITPQQNL